MGSAYLSQADVHMRLDNTICMYKGFPYYVRVNSDDPVNTVRLYKLSNLNAKWVRVLTTHEDFNSKAPAVGFVNHDFRTAYLIRHPDRRQKEGLPTSGMETTGRISLRELIYSDGMENMLSNNYPDVTESLHRIRNDMQYQGIAFHRDFACIRNTNISMDTLELHFRDRVIGVWDEEKEAFVLYPGLKDASFLRPSLSKVKIPCA